MEQAVILNWSVLIHVYKLENDSFVKLTELNYVTIHPSNFEKQKVSMATNILTKKLKQFYR